VLRTLTLTLSIVLVVLGLGMMLTATAGGAMFGLGSFTAALALWLLYRGVVALELQADLLAQSLHQRRRAGRDHAEPLHEEGRASRPVPAGD